MKALRLTLLVAFFAALFTQCEKDHRFDRSFRDGFNFKKDGFYDKKAKSTPQGRYTVMVENISTPYTFFEAGVASIPEGNSEAGPALPGKSYKFSFHAGPAHKLSFATMYGWSNDGFYAPGGNGISLYNGDNPVTGDITSKIMLWDAGTEMNQMPGSSNMHDGANTTANVQLMSAVGDGFDYGMVATNLKVTLDYNGKSLFTLTIENLNGSTTPISPVAWVVHSIDNPLFEAGTADYGKGLEDLAETGNAGPLGDYLSSNSGYVSPVAPVLWVLHDKDDYPVFTTGTPDYGIGLEALAETGNPEPLYESLKAEGYETGFQATRTDGSTGPLFPGQKYSFTIDGHVGQSLSIACMLGASNDIFFSNGDQGIKLSYGIAEVSLHILLICMMPGQRSMNIRVPRHRLTRKNMVLFVWSMTVYHGRMLLR